MLAILWVLGVLVFLICLGYLYFTRNFNFWKKHGFPFLKPIPFVGNLGQVFIQKIDVASYLKNLYLEHKGKPYLGIFAFDKPGLLINDLDLLRNVLVKDFQNFTDRTVSVSEDVDPMFARTLFSLKGREWRHVRLHLTATFTSGKMKNMFHLVEKCAVELDSFLQNSTAQGKCYFQ